MFLSTLFFITYKRLFLFVALVRMLMILQTIEDHFCFVAALVMHMAIDHFAILQTAQRPVFWTFIALVRMLMLLLATVVDNIIPLKRDCRQDKSIGRTEHNNTAQYGHETSSNPFVF